ncbi:MAG: YraN family protein [Deltaproteobacteria bacterium]|nr:YraN family protein [Deltaproteobacteria bacterium]MBU51335.1 YraN family protein [Deltaproteobacteria bacterium]|tara:strand:- start:3412 stop:3801 length:390 start_codon:yes stop_codon:yes gene_type:complete
MVPKPPKQKHNRRGQQAEALASVWLQSQGYELLTHNYRCRTGEIDIVAMDGDVLVFIEVRSLSRRPTEEALSSIHHKKQQRLQKAAQHYLAFQADNLLDPEIRFDVLGVSFRTEHDIECQLLKGALFPF